jgi:hypothetical protein
MRLSRPGWAAAALALYSVTAWLLLAHKFSLTTHVLGVTPDPGALIWCLGYLPWAVAHHQVSPVTHLVWQPYGLNLAWITAVPLLGLIMAPVTIVAGPVLSFNLLTLAAPALAGWAAYFLCLELCELPLAALLGGFLFAFSSYEAAQSLDHLNLDFTVLIPLILLVGLRRVRGRAGRGRTAIWLGLLLGGEFLISEELLATLCLFCGIAFLLAYAVEPPRRAALRALALDVVLAAPLALLLAAPVLFAMTQGTHEVAHPAYWVSKFSIDALNVLLPTPASGFGGVFFTPLTHRFSGGLDEQTGYLGLGVLLLLCVILADANLRRLLWLPLIMLGLVLLAALGPVLHVAGHATGLILPWALIARLPLLGAALPARCMVYVFLLLAIVLSLWVGERPGRRRLLAAGCICLSLLPLPHPAPALPSSVFFRPGRVEQVLGPDPRLLILPFGFAGPSSFWQAESDFSFTQVGGYLGYPPGWAQRDPAVMLLFASKPDANLAADLARLCALRGAQYVVAGPGTPPEDLTALASLGWSAQKIDDVMIYTVPPSAAGTP